MVEFWTMRSPPKKKLPFEQSVIVLYTSSTYTNGSHRLVLSIHDKGLTFENGVKESFTATKQRRQYHANTQSSNNIWSKQNTQWDPLFKRWEKAEIHTPRRHIVRNKTTWAHNDSRNRKPVRWNILLLLISTRRPRSALVDFWNILVVAIDLQPMAPTRHQSMLRQRRWWDGHKANVGLYLLLQLPRCE